MKLLYGPTSLAVQSKSDEIPYGSRQDAFPLERNECVLQLDEVFEMKPLDFLQERVSLGTVVSDPLISNEAWFNSRKMPIRHLRSSSDNSLGFSIKFCLGIFPVFLRGTSYSAKIISKIMVRIWNN
jgi:hypothetical protein